MDSAQRVFDSKDLRKLIYTHVIHAKFKEELAAWMLETVMRDVENHWCMYCTCNACMKRAREWIQDV